MATPLHSRATCVFVAPTVAGGKLREGGRIATAVCVPRQSSNSFKLRCTLDESNVSSSPSAVDLAPPTIDLEIVGGKVMNCGGGGSCGTCVVEILEGKELLNERTDTEYKYLKKKPESWRLSCQTIVGDKSNSGKVVVQRLPQKKK